MKLLLVLRPSSILLLPRPRALPTEQMHFHTPSEHTIDGEHFPLEMHMVHQLDDPGVAHTPHRLLVVVLLFELGECSEMLARLHERFPEQRGASSLIAEKLFLSIETNLQMHRGFYYWMGSLTTPPCTEGVRWLLLKARSTVCPSQVNQFRQALHLKGFGLVAESTLQHRDICQDC